MKTLGLDSVCGLSAEPYCRDVCVVVVFFFFKCIGLGMKQSGQSDLQGKTAKQLSTSLYSPCCRIRFFHDLVTFLLLFLMTFDNIKEWPLCALKLCVIISSSNF